MNANKRRDRLLVLCICLVVLLICSAMFLFAEWFTDQRALNEFQTAYAETQSLCEEHQWYSAIEESIQKLLREEYPTCEGYLSCRLLASPDATYSFAEWTEPFIGYEFLSEDSDGKKTIHHAIFTDLEVQVALTEFACGLRQQVPVMDFHYDSSEEVYIISLDKADQLYQMDEDTLHRYWVKVLLEVYS